MGFGTPGKVLVMFFMTKLYCAAMAALFSGDADWNWRLT
jgi:hypothetical protein